MSQFRLETWNMINICLEIFYAIVICATIFWNIKQYIYIGLKYICLTTIKTIIPKGYGISYLYLKSNVN